MYKRFRKTAAVLMAAAMLFQSGLSGAAAEMASETEWMQEAAEDEAIGEIGIATDLEEDGDGLAELGDIAGDEIEAGDLEDAEASVGLGDIDLEESQEDTAAEEEQTEKKETEEKQTEEQTKEKETEEKETEVKETEKSERENTGEKYSSDALVSALGGVLPYMFTASSISVPETLLNERILMNDASVMGGLKEFSRKLANGKSSSDVRILNLYADEKGKLDTAQLDALYQNKVIDVTKQYYVVNVIAASAQQNLNFAGYDMIIDGAPVSYEKDTQPGDILYNFAALEDGKYVDYEGTLTLSKPGKLQGTFMAPKAKVIVASDLAGAVYADRITVNEGISSLTEIVFRNGQSAEITADATQMMSLETAEDVLPEEAIDNDEIGELEIGYYNAELVDMEEDELMSEFTDTIDGEIEDTQLAGLGLLDEEMSIVTLTVSVKAVDASGKETGDKIKNAAFVVKDKTGKVITDENGAPRYFFTYPGEDGKAKLSVPGLIPETSYILSQLRTADGYQVAEDISFTSGTEEKPENITVKNKKITEDMLSVTVTAQASYQGITLTPADDLEATDSYLAVFRSKKPEDDEEGEDDQTEVEKVRVSQVIELTYLKENQTSGQAVLKGLPVLSGDMIYTLEAVDQGGEITEPGKGKYEIASQELIFTDKKASADVKLTYNQYPDDLFYYQTPAEIILKMEKPDAKALETTFYAALFADSEGEDPITADPKLFTFKLAKDSSGNATASAKAAVKLFRGTQKLYLKETDASGVPVVTSSDFPYGVKVEPHEITAECKADKDSENGLPETIKATITNTTDITGVRINAVDASGEYLKGITMVIKNGKGQIVSINSQITYESGKKDIAINGLAVGETYYLSEISAPEGYMPCEDVKFTVGDNQMAVISLVHKKATSTKYRIDAVKQVYANGVQAYAYDIAGNVYRKNGQYTSYVALFKDAAHTQKVSNVQEMEVKEFSGTTSFLNLQKNAVYYVAETDEYGEPLSDARILSSDNSVTTGRIRYAANGEVKTTSNTNTTTIQNDYTTLPDGYRYTASLTICLKVTDNNGGAATVSDTFYAGIYRKSDYSDTPTIVSLPISNASSVSVQRRILLSGSSDVVYYIAEVDASGKRITNDSDFAYSPSIDTPEVVLSKGAEKTVTINNRQKADSKATLYITKRVYEGGQPKAVNETFYAGLFKDSSFKTLYTQPIALNMQGKSELTLKLSLNLGADGNTTIYVAEVDKNGNIIKDARSFGYEVKMMNSSASFSSDRREVQTVIMNSVYGSTSNGDWDGIFSGGDWGEYGGSFTDNGEASSTSAAQTGDDTPIALYVGMMAGALILLLLILILKKRRK